MKVRAEDKTHLPDGTVTGSYSDPTTVGTDVHYFIVDDTPPTVLLQEPAATEVNSLTMISGTANADLGGLSRVQVRVQRIAGGADEDWTGSSWTATNEHYSTATFSPGAGDITWSYTDLGADGVDFRNNEEYRVFVRAYDKAGNERVPGGGELDFKYDDEAPIIGISYPFTPPAQPALSHRAESSRLIELSSGTITDNWSGVDEVWVAVSSGLSKDYWYNDASGLFDLGPLADIQWTTEVYKAKEMGGTKWELFPSTWSKSFGPSHIFSDGVKYVVYVNAKDKAGNWVKATVPPLQPADIAAAQQQQFKYDITKPVGSVTAPSDGASARTLTEFAGQGQDLGSQPSGPSGVKAIYAAVEHLKGPPLISEGKYWDWVAKDFVLADPGDDTASDAWVLVASAAPSQVLSSIDWSTSVPAGMLVSSSTYRVMTLVVDQATNKQLDPTGAGNGNAFRFDNEAPEVVILTPEAVSYNLAGLSDMAGTAFDGDSGAAGLQNVRVLLKSNQIGGGGAGAGYWNGGDTNDLADWDTEATSKYDRWQNVTAPLSAWTKAFPTITFLDSTRFTLWVGATDYAGNYTDDPSQAQKDADLNADNSAAIVFTYDNTKPRSRVTYPPRYANDPSMLMISGTSTDDFWGGARQPSLVTKVQYKLSRSDGDWWQTLGGWGVEPSYANVDAGPTNPWTKGITLGNLEDGYEYYATARSSDNAGNLEDSIPTYGFIVDLTTAVGRVNSPVDGGFANASLSQIAGTADDRFCTIVNQAEAANPLCGAGTRDFQSGIGIDSVTISIQDLTFPTTFWNGTAWVDNPTPIYSTATFVGDSSGTWSYAFPSLYLTSPRQYKVRVRVADRAGNQTPDDDSFIYESTFVYDISAPDSRVTFPAGPQGGMSSITGTANDAAPGELENSGDDILVSIYEEASDCTGSCNPGKYWHGDAWRAGELWLASGTVTGKVGGGACTSGDICEWSFDAGLVSWDNRSTYTVTARALDRAANSRPIPGSEDVRFYLQTPAPVITVDQPPAVGGLPHYQSTDGNINFVDGEGQNLKLTDGVRVVLRRLTNPTSYWYDVDSKWSNDSSTYSVLNVVDGGPQTWNKNINSPYSVKNASYVMTLIGLNVVNEQTVPPTVRTFIVDDTLPTGAFVQPAPAACPGAPGVDACLSSLPTLTGTVVDPGNPDISPSVVDVFTRVRDNDAAVNTHWNGSAFAPFGPQSDLRPSTAPALTVPWSTATLAGPALQDGVNYSLFLLASDKAGNIESDESKMTEFKFVYDKGLPNAYFIHPSSGEVYMNLDTITGTAADPAGQFGSGARSGLSSVRVRVYHAGSDTCFNGGGFGGCTGASYLTVSGVDNWQYQNPVLTSSLLDENTYYITIEAEDAATNKQAGFNVPNSSRSVKTDFSPPSAGFTKPAMDDSYHPNVLSGGSGLVGTAADPQAYLYPGGDALLEDDPNQKGVEVVIWYLDGGTTYFFNPTACNPQKYCSGTDKESSFRKASSTASWKVFMAVDGSDWVSDKNYRAQVRARDRARVSTGTLIGNVGPPGGAYTPTEDHVEFIVDGTPPVTEIRSQVNGTFVQDLNFIEG